MADRAQVDSLEAIEAFRAALLVYATKTRALLEEIDDEKRRLKVWVQDDRRVFWEREYARRNRALETAQQELLSARISSYQTHTAAQLLAVERAKQAVREAERKRETIRKWAREFDHRIEPLSKEVQLLHGFLSSDLVKAVAHLTDVLKILEAYVGIRLQTTPEPQLAGGDLKAASASTEGAPAATARPSDNPGAGSS